MYLFLLITLSFSAAFESGLGIDINPILWTIFFSLFYFESGSSDKILNVSNFFDHLPFVTLLSRKHSCRGKGKSSKRLERTFWRWKYWEYAFSGEGFARIGLLKGLCCILASANSADKILKRLCIKLLSLRNISGDNVSMYILLSRVLIRSNNQWLVLWFICSTCNNNS